MTSDLLSQARDLLATPVAFQAWLESKRPYATVGYPDQEHNPLVTFLTERLGTWGVWADGEQWMLIDRSGREPLPQWAHDYVWLIAPRLRAPDPRLRARSELRRLAKVVG